MSVAPDRYFHGSSTRLEIGTILTPRGNAYEADWGKTGFYPILERFRPPKRLAHKQAVFMVGSPNDIDCAGGGTEWVFELLPLGPVTRHDLNWSSQISCLLSENHDANSPQIREAAENYWRGSPHPNESVWEYLTSSAQIIAVEPF
jgi:hypothetical protein